MFNLSLTLILNKFFLVVAWSALSPMFVVVISQLYWYVMVFLLKKLPHVPESDPLNGVN